LHDSGQRTEGVIVGRLMWVMAATKLVVIVYLLCEKKHIVRIYEAERLNAYDLE